MKNANQTRVVKAFCLKSYLHSLSFDNIFFDNISFIIYNPIKDDVTMASGYIESLELLDKYFVYHFIMPNIRL